MESCFTPHIIPVPGKLSLLEQEFARLTTIYHHAVANMAAASAIDELGKEITALLDEIYSIKKSIAED